VFAAKVQEWTMKHRAFDKDYSTKNPFGLTEGVDVFVLFNKI
jgi:hypothetical protein